MTNSFPARIGLPKVIVPPCAVNDSDLGWHYDLRHQAQEVIPGLWVGPLSVLRNTAFLEQHNIRVLISVTDIRITPVIIREKYRQSPEYSCHAFDPGNKLTNPLAIVSQLASICEVIGQAQQSNIGTLIFCESGNEQSAVAAVSYLIYSQHMGMIQAIQEVQTKRFSISLDDAAKHNLQTFYDLCVAHNHQSQNNSDHTKRSRGREYDADESGESEASGTSKRQFRNE